MKKQYFTPLFLAINIAPHKMISTSPNFGFGDTTDDIVGEVKEDFFWDMND